MSFDRSQRPIPQIGDEIANWDVRYRVVSVDFKAQTLDIFPIPEADERIPPEENHSYTIPFSQLPRWAFRPRSA